MIIVKSLTQANKCLKSAVVALGNFDGVHKGHQALIAKCVEIAKEKGLTSVVFTFINHPVNEIEGKSIVKNIMTFDEKAAAIQSLGVDVLVAVPFNATIRQSKPEDFAKKVLKKDLHARHAVCGYNFSFGFKGEGTPQMLEKFGEKFDFGVTKLDEIDIEGKPVSSTRIREMIADGDMEGFERLTGRPYTISGKVIHGEHFGRTMGFPTVNLSLNNDMALPLNGVYITYIYVSGNRYHSVTNVGNKPSVGEFAKNAETHIFDFEGDIYGCDVSVEFIKMLRKERKFDSIEELAKQIDTDCIQAREIHTKLGFDK